MERLEPEGSPSGTPETDPDARLVMAAGRGDAQAFRSLVDRHADRLYRLAVSLVGNSADAEDVLQETFTGAFRGLSGFRQQASVKTWLTQILVRQAAKTRRDRTRGGLKRSELSELNSLESVGASVMGRDALVDQSIDLHAALRQLSREHREILVLREFEHQSYEEMAETLGVPRGTVESRLSRARAELKRLMPSYSQA